jgi:hypothetical protein
METALRLQHTAHNLPVGERRTKVLLLMNRLYAAIMQQHTSLLQSLYEEVNLRSQIEIPYSPLHNFICISSGCVLYPASSVPHTAHVFVLPIFQKEPAAHTPLLKGVVRNLVVTMAHLVPGSRNPISLRYSGAVMRVVMKIMVLLSIERKLTPQEVTALVKMYGIVRAFLPYGDPVVNLMIQSMETNIPAVQTPLSGGQPDIRGEEGGLFM